MRMGENTSLQPGFFSNPWILIVKRKFSKGSRRSKTRRDSFPWSFEFGTLTMPTSVTSF